jgi:hypothetical protein
MADNLGYTPGSGANVATEELGGIHHQRVIAEWMDDAGNPYNAGPSTPMPVTGAGELMESLEAVRMAVQALTRTMGQMQPDTAARMRVAIDSISAGLTLATLTTVGTVTTVSTLSNVTSLGGYSATETVPSFMRMGADSLRRNIGVS